MQKSEMLDLAKRYETNTQFIQALLNGGVVERDVEEMLELRAEATMHFRIHGRYRDTDWEEMPSAKVLAELYSMVEGDPDLMGIVVDRALSDAHHRRLVRHGTCDSAFKRVMSRGLHFLIYNEQNESDFGGLVY